MLRRRAWLDELHTCCCRALLAVADILSSRHADVSLAGTSLVAVLEGLTLQLDLLVPFFFFFLDVLRQLCVYALNGCSAPLFTPFTVVTDMQVAASCALEAQVFSPCRLHV